jgi:hypothetical protein
MKKCPCCAGELQDMVAVCQYCGRKLPNRAAYGLAVPKKKTGLFTKIVWARLIF